MELNTLELASALQQLGDRDKRWIFTKIVRELQRETITSGAEPRPLSSDEIARIRLAPSIITRGEAELFGISSPRFALRFYLRQGGFVDCRRLNEFTDHVSRFAQLWVDQRVEPVPSVRDLLLSSNQQPPLIADCLIPPPPIFSSANKFRYISSNGLPAAYGEEKEAQYSETLLPFVGHLEAAGGLCSQAVCFIATVLLLRYANGVFGMGEITALANSKRTILELSGLDSLGMYRYFKKVGLRFSEQAQSFGETFNGNEPAETLNVRRNTLARAIRAYLYSGIPIIAPTDAMLLGTAKFRYETGHPMPIYERNWRPVRGTFKDTGNAHSIILVGYREGRGTPPRRHYDHIDQNASPSESEPSRFSHLLNSVDAQRANKEDEYVFHDPTRGPYLRLGITELFEVPATSDDGEEVSYTGVIMPVTPAAARLPLLDTRTWGPRKKYFYGLWSITDAIAVYFQDKEPGYLNLVTDQAVRSRFAQRARPGYSFTNRNSWMLVDIASPSSITSFQEFVSAQSDEELARLLSLKFDDVVKANLRSSPSKPLQLMWAEVHPGIVWLWDAQKSPLPYKIGPTVPLPSPGYLLRHYLALAVFIGSNGEPKVITYSMLSSIP